MLIFHYRNRENWHGLGRNINLVTAVGYVNCATRGKKAFKSDYTEAELEQIRKRLEERERLLQKRREAVQREARQIESERCNLERIREDFASRELELSKGTDTMHETDLEKSSVLREINNLRHQVNNLKENYSHSNMTPGSAKFQGLSPCFPDYYESLRITEIYAMH